MFAACINYNRTHQIDREIHFAWNKTWIVYVTICGVQREIVVDFDLVALCPCMPLATYELIVVRHERAMLSIGIALCIHVLHILRIDNSLHRQIGLWLVFILCSATFLAANYIHMRVWNVFTFVTGEFCCSPHLHNRKTAFRYMAPAQYAVHLLCTTE